MAQANQVPFRERLNDPLTQSILLHFSFVLFFLFLKFAFSIKLTSKVDFEVIEFPKPSATLAPAAAPIEKPIAEPVQRKVFGINKKSLTTASDTDQSVETKIGNTVAKENDNLTMTDEDADNLPIPTDEFMVKSMPVVTKEVQAAYPIVAKQKEIEGVVVMDILVDQFGKVRQATVVRGPGYGMEEAALEAIKGFEFRPAQTADGPVAVRIRYTYRFSITD